MTLPEVADSVGVEYRTLHSWVKRGLLTPTHPANGTGHSARLTDDDVRVARLLARLRRAGCDIRVLKRAAEDVDATELYLGEGVVLTWQLEA
jgi:DNA-binding transcriptional MerR regulator